MSDLQSRDIHHSPTIWIIMGVILFVALPIVFFASWLGLASFSRTYFPQLQDKRIVLLIAHCDDEAMFFSPTLQALTKPELRNHVEILCLSPGSSVVLYTLREGVADIVYRCGETSLRDSKERTTQISQNFGPVINFRCYDIRRPCSVPGQYDYAVGSRPHRRRALQKVLALCSTRQEA
jgi:hypothetical protein